MTHPVVPTTWTSRPTAQRSDVQLVVDVALGVAGETLGAGAALFRTTANLPVLRARAVWRPWFVPTRFQPASLVTGAADRGAQHREWAARRLAGLLDQWVPVIMEMVVARLDLTELVKSHVDLDEVVRTVDLVAVVEEVIEAIDLPAIIRESSGSMASETIRGARMTGISVDDAISRSLERYLFRHRRVPTVPEDSP